MPSVDDVYNQLTDANTRLEQIKSELLDLKTSEDAVKTAVQQVNTTLTAGFGDLVTLGIYTNAALFQNAKQNDTIICLLEHISKHTCGIWNESHLQTGLQTSIDEHTTTLTELYEVTHGEAALERERLEKLRKQIEECCPPPKPEPVCRDEKCPAPGKLPEPPKVKQPKQPKDDVIK